ncbi:DegT/DnrJ/EryC1/StrS family aminotransferase [Candidatus Omnitrophota bacterium]
MKNENDYIVFGSPCIEQPEIDEIVHSLKSGWIGTGPKVAQFEKQFAEHQGMPYAIAVNSCTAALFLSMKVLGIGPGDEVITTPLTFCATVNAIIHTGATPVLADIDPLTMNISPSAVESCITSRTKAILPVHFAGRSCDMNVLCALTKKHNLFLVEDCAHAIETRHKGKNAGSFGVLGCFSFYVTKNITTAEGGMILTRDKTLAERLKILALHGMSHDAWKRFSDDGYKHYLVVEPGYKFNMIDLQACLGIHQLQRIKKYHHQRRVLWERYMEAFADLPVQLPAEILPVETHAYHLFTLLIDEKNARISRDQFMLELHKRGIGSGVHYMSIPEHPFYHDQYGWDPDAYPNAKRVGRQTVSLPFSPNLSNDQVLRVINSVREIIFK